MYNQISVTLDIDAKEATPSELINEHLEWASSFLRTLLRRYSTSVSTYDDLLSAGLLGLVNAANNFNARLDKPFQALATTCMRRAVADQKRHVSAEKRYIAHDNIVNFNDTEDVILNSLSSSHPAGSPEKIAAERQIGALLKDALSWLLPIEYAVLEQHIAEDRTFADIAVRLKLPSRTAAFKIYQRTINTLRTRVSIGVSSF